MASDGWRVRVDHDLISDGVTVHIGHRSGSHLYLVEPFDLALSESASDPVALSRPSLRLSDELARCLLDALTAHFGGTSDVRTLRADMLHERGRVDQMIGYLVSADASQRFRSSRAGD